MEPKIKKAIEKYHNRLEESFQETKILYEINELEAILLIHTIRQAIQMEWGVKLTVKILKAAAHLIERSEEDWRYINDESKRS